MPFIASLHFTKNDAKSMNSAITMTVNHSISISKMYASTKGSLAYAETQNDHIKLNKESNPWPAQDLLLAHQSNHL